MSNLATWIRDCDEHWFIPLFARWPDIVIHNARERQVDVHAMDALLLTGGGDISAEFLTQKVTEPKCIIDTDSLRDRWEFCALREILAAKKPLLAICVSIFAITTLQRLLTSKSYDTTPRPFIDSTR